MKQKEAGQGLVEYALILVLVAIVVIAVMRLLGPQIGTVFSTIECPSSAPPPVILLQVEYREDRKIALSAA